MSIGGRASSRLILQNFLCQGSTANLLPDLINFFDRAANILTWNSISITVSPLITTAPHFNSFLAGTHLLAASRDRADPFGLLHSANVSRECIKRVYES